jgi:cytochrome b subunit of formate dehydrogenase
MLLDPIEPIRKAFTSMEFLSKMTFPLRKYRLLVVPLLISCVLPLHLAAQTKADCLMCHGDKSLTTVKRGKTVSLYVNEKNFSHSVHGELDCVACHEGFKPDQLPHAKKIKPVQCQSCHDGDQFERYKKSVHATLGPDGKPRVPCSGCHTTHEVRSLSGADPATRKQFAQEVCATCHAAENAKFMASDHGRALADGMLGAPSCIDCHDEHAVLAATNDSARTNRRNVAAMCEKCHIDDPAVREKVASSSAFISSYENSVHGQALKNGNDSAATCTDCHGGHEMKKGSDPSSLVARRNVAKTCGRCHRGVFAQYEGSIHGTAMAEGVKESATCTDCHGEHNILSPKDARSPVAARNVSRQVCSPCHASVKLTQKYGLASDRFQSFADSYHGLAGRAGSVEVANCASCHGVHDIKPSSDPTSRINKANLAKTCGTCHPGANENFTKGLVHVIATEAKGEGKDNILYLVSSGYIILIVVTIGGMLLHNLLDLIKKSRKQLMYRRGLIQRPPIPHRLWLRMSLSERIQHGLLLASFITLVVTGFALRFPDAWWVAPMRDFSPWMFELRSLLHRIAAVVMVGASLYHVYYIMFVPRGKRLLRDLLPVYQDVIDAIQVMKYNLGFSKEKPLFGRFSYIEKSEYWALVWGTVVMATTGIIMWFDNTFLGLLGKLWWDVARTVHYYEAWLATLAIIVWHFYFVIFNPDSYPINLAFWKGTLTEEEMEEEHPLELEQLKHQAGQAEASEERDHIIEVNEDLT